ncbi:MAG: hypothetical protein ACOY40_12615 [Bacillota bacterium]
MTVIKDVLRDELNRLERMRVAYNKKLEELPKGVLVIKRIRNRKYHYLQYRDGGKIKSVYIRKDMVPEYEKLIKQRMEHQKSLKNINNEIDFVNKALKLR